MRFLINGPCASSAPPDLVQGWRLPSAMSPAYRRDAASPRDQATAGGRRVTRADPRCPSLQTHDRQFVQLEPLRSVRRVDSPKTQALVGMHGIPGHTSANGLGAGRRQGKYQRLCRVMCDVPGHAVMLLMDVSVECRDVSERRQQIERRGAVPRHPLPFRCKVEQRPMRADRHGMLAMQGRQLPLQPTQLFISESPLAVGDIVECNELDSFVDERVVSVAE